MSYKTDEPCIGCGNKHFQRTYHHIKSRGSGGTDEVHNLMPLCLADHNRVHSIGLRAFAEHRPDVMKWLLDRGWYICGLQGKWKHPKN